METKNTTTYEIFKAKYDEQKAKHPDALFLFRMGDFYEMYFDDAKRGAELLGIVLQKRKMGAQTLPVAWFPHHAIDTYLPRLIRAGQRVAIWDPLDVPSTQAREVVIPNNIL